jgi:hypothetical protein
MSLLEGYETVAEAAQRLNLVPSRIRQLLLEGRIPGAVQLPGGAWVVPQGVVPISRGRGPKPKWEKKEG